MRAKKMPFKNLWEKELAGDMGASEASELINRFQNKYRELCDNHPEIPHAALKKHLHGNIFPQMAAYTIFLEDNTSETALMRIQKLHMLTLINQRKSYEMFCMLPFSFRLLRIICSFRTKFTFPSTGWKIEWLENNNDFISLKIHSCFYYEIMKEYGMPKLISIYCDGDNYVFKDIKSRYIGWGRTKTLSGGSDYCDSIHYNKARKLKLVEPNADRIN